MPAKKKKSRGKQSMVSKAINIGGVLLGLSNILYEVFTNLTNPRQIGINIVRGATFGLSEGSFDLAQGATFYGPIAAVVPYRMFTSYLLRKFPVRK